jgi:hypothetical protein
LEKRKKCRRDDKLRTSLESRNISLLPSIGLSITQRISMDGVPRGTIGKSPTCALQALQKLAIIFLTKLSCDWANGALRVATAGIELSE